MEKSEDILNEMDTYNQETAHAAQPLPPQASGDGLAEKTNGNNSQTLFPDSPVYEPEEDMEIISSTTDDSRIVISSDSKDEEKSIYPKRKHLEDIPDSNAKMQKLDLIEEVSESTQALDNEVSEITSAAKRKLMDLELPSTSRVRTPVRSSPRKIKRSNSADIANPKTPKTPKARPASVDVTKVRKTPRVKIDPNSKTHDVHVISSDSSSSRPSVEFIREIPAPEVPETIAEENSELQDSQDVHLTFSDDDSDNKPKEKYYSDPVIVKDREEIVESTKNRQTHSAGYNYSDLSNNLSQPIPKDYNLSKTTDQASTDSVSSINLESPDHIPSLASKDGVVKGQEDSSEILQTHSAGYNYTDQGKNPSRTASKDYNLGKTTDQESTDSVCSINLESPDHIPTVASKLISKLSNGDSSTPTEGSGDSKHDTDVTPDMMKLSSSKGKRIKNESFRASNNTTPSTISPLQNGHSLPISTPQLPLFDVHISHSEENEFLSLYVVRTDNDLGMDMCKEYQRISKRFTLDPYLADVSVSNSPSSVTSGGLVNLPNRTSFASTTTSTSTSSNRTSDGNFVVPQPPRKSVINPTSSVKGYEALMKKLQDIFSHLREASVDSNRSMSDDNKVSVGVQTSVSTDSNMSNGNASPEEVGKCDKATPKSSLKKSRVRGRRHIAGKTKRALLPTQAEEPELQGMNSPEMVPTNGENGKDSQVKSPKDEKPLSSLVATPKSISKLKQKRRPTSPRPATPVEKVVVKPEYPGFPPGTAVLAKWVDRRYYSGRVLEITELNKYLIKFDDGQSKVLLDDFIIFGDMKTLPLDGQSVYAIVDEEQNYEPGLVLGVEENDSGTVTYRCTTDGDTIVMVTASELYLTEDQARSLKESVRPRSPSAPSTPRRRHNRELDLDNIIHGPRSARSRDKGNSSARKRVASPKSPKASTSGVKTKGTVVVGRRRPASESSEMSESSNSAPARLEEVAGVEPEVQRTPRKIDGVKAGPLQLKGAAKQNIGKKNSKLTKFENDEDTVSKLGPIPCGEKKIFAGLHFLLTCTETPKRFGNEKNNPAQIPKITALKKEYESQDARQYSSEEDTEASVQGTDTEDLEFSDRPFNKERLKEQLEAGGGVVHSHFDDVPKSKYSVCKLIAARPCVTAKYIQCLAADIRAVSHAWVIVSCARAAAQDLAAYALPAGWSLTHKCHLNWLQNGKRNATFFKDKIILLCGDQDTFVKFWERVCTLAGATTRVVNEEDLNMSGAYALVTEWDCPHEVQNKANQDNIPLVATEWVVQCLIEAKVLPPTSHDRFSFMYTEQE